MQLRHSIHFLLSAISFLALTASFTFGDVRLPGFFGDHMVLQQDKPIRVWGWAEAGESIKVSFANSNAQATADASGKWRVELPGLKGGSEAFTLIVTGKANELIIKDILVGEVWLCSGQSNMAWTVQKSANPKEEIAAADYPMIRHLKIENKPSNVPVDDLMASWQICSPETAAEFTACGYYMARELHKELKVPVGLINSSWGGTRIEPWIPPVGYRRVPAMQKIYQTVLERTPGSDLNRELIAAHIANTERWLTETKEALSRNQSVTPSPEYPQSALPFSSHQEPAMLYNRMIHPLVGYPIRGVIWYQGEANHNEGALYTEKKKALISGWRELWAQGDFPFYYVQLAPFKYGNENGAVLAEFWEAQAAAQQIPNTGMVVTNDIATYQDIHPPNKQDVGRRLALLALKNDYGREVVANSPEMESMQMFDGSILIRFKNTAGGLRTRDGKTTSHFELIGPGSGGFQAAEVAIDGDTIKLTSSKIRQPTAFRFGWDKSAQPNLMGGTGLPVATFRGGTEPDFLNQIPVAKDYRLVYDLNLENLGRKSFYDKDNSQSTTKFSRIAYLVELQKQDGTEQAIFVTMPAFTDDASKIGLPTFESRANFQKPIDDLQVFSNVGGIVTGEGIETGNMEFWSDNYGPKNSGGIRDATDDQFDFGDERTGPANGYGSMQIHNFGAKQTLFAINHWNDKPDIGIGNNPSGNPDWTFSANASSYTKKRMRVFVK